MASQCVENSNKKTCVCVCVYEETQRYLKQALNKKYTLQGVLKKLGRKKGRDGGGRATVT
jgi:hypothetical protein